MQPSMLDDPVGFLNQQKAQQQQELQGQQYEDILKKIQAALAARKGMGGPRERLQKQKPQTPTQVTSGMVPVPAGEDRPLMPVETSALSSMKSPPQRLGTPVPGGVTTPQIPWGALGATTPSAPPSDPGGGSLQSSMPGGLGGDVQTPNMSKISALQKKIMGLSGDSQGAIGKYLGGLFQQ